MLCRTQATQAGSGTAGKALDDLQGPRREREKKRLTESRNGMARTRDGGSRADVRYPGSFPSYGVGQCSPPQPWFPGWLVFFSFFPVP